MKLIDKPEGFELRDRRSDKSNLGSEWTVQDALYDASQEMAKQDTTDAIVVWRERVAEGKYLTHFRFAGQSDCNGPALLLGGLGKIMGWG